MRRSGGLHSFQGQTGNIERGNGADVMKDAEIGHDQFLVSLCYFLVQFFFIHGVLNEIYL